MKKIKILQEDCDDNIFRFYVEVSDESIELCKSIEARDIYYYIKKYIGIVTHSGKSKFIPRLQFGDIEASVQVSYQLYSLRFDKQTEYGPVDNSPMTEEEFYEIMGHSPEDDKRVDIKFKVGSYLGAADTFRISRVADTIRKIGNDLTFKEQIY